MARSTIDIEATFVQRDVDLIEIDPDDTLVVRAHGEISEATRAAIRTEIEQTLSRGGLIPAPRVIVIDDTLTLTVLRRPGIAARPAPVAGGRGDDIAECVGR